MIYPLLVIIGFVLGYICCMFDVSRNFQKWEKESYRHVDRRSASGDDSDSR